MSALGEEVAAEQEATELRAALRRAQRQLAKEKAKTADLTEAVYQAAKDAALAVGLPQPISRPPRDRRKHELHALLHLTDWQAGKETPTYNLDVMADRVREAVRKTIRITEIERADHPVRSIHLMLGGDLVEGGGNIFPGQVHEIEARLLEQVFAASGLVEETIITLLAEYEYVHAWWVSGNHGRLGKRGEYHRRDNADELVCRIAQGRTKDLPRLTWHDPDPHDDWFVIVGAGAYRALMVHGHEVPRTVPAILRKAHEWASGVMEPWNDMFYGHVHSELVLGLKNGSALFVTPSTESTNRYAKQVIAALGRPAQRLHFVDPVKGRRASERLLFLT